MNLPQTAIVSIQAPLQLPSFLLPNEEIIHNNRFTGAYQWYLSFDLTSGEIIDRPNETDLMTLTRKLSRFIYLTFVENRFHPQLCFPSNKIFFMGFSQGAQIALYTTLKSPVTVCKKDNGKASSSRWINWGGVMAISGTLFDFSHRDGSLLNSDQEWNQHVPVFLSFGSQDDVVPLNVYKETVNQLNKNIPSSNLSLCVLKKGHQMPKDEKEMRAIFTFYSKLMSLRNLTLESMADIVEVESFSSR